MADLQQKLDDVLLEVPRCIHLAGVDGSGKTTQGKALLDVLNAHGLEVQYVWLRFPRLFSIPFLVYARLRGYSYREVTNGYEHGYWSFGKSWLMSIIFPWVLLLDTFLFALFKVYLPLWLGRRILCDRFVIDTLVDLMVGLDKPHYDEQITGRLFLNLLPHGTRVVILDLETNIALQRSPELHGDRSHARRRQTYLDVAERQDFPIISTEMPVEKLTARLLDVIQSSKEVGHGQETSI